jgi:hypothetical protein
MIESVDIATVSTVQLFANGSHTTNRARRLKESINVLKNKVLPLHPPLA